MTEARNPFDHGLLIKFLESLSPLDRLFPVQLPRPDQLQLQDHVSTGILRAIALEIAEKIADNSSGPSRARPEIPPPVNFRLLVRRGFPCVTPIICDLFSVFSSSSFFFFFSFPTRFHDRRGYKSVLLEFPPRPPLPPLSSRISF